MKFSKFLKTGLILFFVVLLGACGKMVEIPPAHVAKLNTGSGMQKGIIPPSQVRLEGLCRVCDSLILAEASDYPIAESMQIFMPKDKLNLTVETRGTVAISNDEANVEKIFSRVTADPYESRVTKISMIKVYATYAQPVIREAVRSVLTQYSIAQIMENRDAVSQKLTQIVREKLQSAPIQVIRFGLADVQPPQVIVDAQEAAKKREIEIQKAEADKQVKLKEAEAALEVANKQQLVDLKEAETQVMVQQKLDKGVTPAFIMQRGLKVLEQLANSKNKVILLPTEALTNPAIMVGVMQEAGKDGKVVNLTDKKGG